jgi:putative membrane protein
MSEIRRPRAVRLADPGQAVVTIIEPPVPAAPTPALVRQGGLAGVSLATIGGLISLALGLALANLVDEAFRRASALGWIALALVLAGALVVIIMIVRELMALRRLAGIDQLRSDAVLAFEASDKAAADRVAIHLDKITAGRPDMMAARERLAADRGRPMGGRDLATLAETTLLGPLDREAVGIVTESAKRIAIVTALSPRAVFDVIAVTMESVRLIRRIAELYGARPGRLGMFRLGRRVVGHLIVTGGLGAGDELLSQLFGHGIAARISAKLGEGLVNGLMTARVGLATLELVRPMPFVACDKPKLSDVAAEIARVATL